MTNESEILKLSKVYHEHLYGIRGSSEELISELHSQVRNSSPQSPEHLDRRDGNTARCLRRLNDAVGELRGRDEELTRAILAGMEKVIQDFGRQNGYTFIFVKNDSVLLFVDEKADLTVDVLKLFNSSQKK